MTRFAQFACALSAAALLTAAPASADYTIEDDPAFPSVIYIHFDPSTMPKVYLAPSSGDLDLSVINGGQVLDQIDASAPNADSPDLKSDDKAASAKKKSSQDANQTASTSPLEQRIDRRVEELSRDQPKVEEMMIDREIEDRLLEESDRLLR